MARRHSGLPPRPVADERGGVAVVVALSITVLCMIAAIAVDVGSVALHARRVQGAADLAALAAARDLPRAAAAAQATAQDNLGAEVEAVTHVGVYSANRSIRPADRFTPVTDPDSASAARVQLSSKARLFFGRWLLGRDSVPIQRAATAARPASKPMAAFSIGSRLARLDAGLANQLLRGLTGSNISLSVMDYNALADADVSLLAFSDALAVDLGVTAGDYDGLLKHDVDAGRALKVLEGLAGRQSSSALSRLSQAATGLNLRLADLIGIEADAPQGIARALDVSVSAGDLATAMLEIGGNRHVELDLGARAGLADVTVAVAIGERPNQSPWLTVTDHGEPVIRTAQTRLQIRARTSAALAGLTQVDLPILIELASAEARLKSLRCTPSRQMVVDVRPGIASAWIGSVAPTAFHDFKTPLKPARATLLSVLGLVKITAFADVRIGNTAWAQANFSAAEIERQTIKTVKTTTIVSSLVTSLLSDLDVDVELLGGPLLGGLLGDLVRPLMLLLTPLTPVLDVVINSVLDLLGLKLGEVDVKAQGLQCPSSTDAAPALVG